MGNILSKIEESLRGRKTYLGAALLAFAVFAETVGWIDSDTFLKVQTILIAWIGASLRAAIK